MCCLVPAEQVTGVDLVLYVIEARVITVRDNGMRALLELIKVVDHFGAKEGRTVFERGFIDDNRRPLGLDALHHTLNGALAEVVGVGLHRQEAHALDRVRLALIDDLPHNLDLYYFITI